jgi:hypothetical protein
MGTGTELGRLTAELDRPFGAAIGEPPKTGGESWCCFADAEPFTMRVRGVMLARSYEVLDFSNADLIVTTVHNFGTEPFVTRLHFLENEVETGFHGDFFEDTIVAIRDFKVSARRRMTLRLKVYEMDQIHSEIVKSVLQAAGSLGVTFPVLAPYTSLAAEGGKTLLQLLETMHRSDRVIDERLMLEVSPASSGHRLLQPGYYVCFGEPVEQDLPLHLSNTLRVMAGEPGSPRAVPFAECSYAVIEIQREFNSGREWLIDQKVSKLVTGLDHNDNSGRAPLEFLRETMDLYDRFRNLERARELAEKRASGALSASERGLLDELLRDPNLAPYLAAVSGPAGRTPELVTARDA